MIKSYDKSYRLKLLKEGWTTRIRRGGKEAKWGDVFNVIRKRLKGNEVVLDIGTAEGRRFLEIASKICFGIGIDKNSSFIKLAKKLQKKRGIKNLEFSVMDSKKLVFGSSQFDVVISRHAPVNIKEVYRVLKPGGLFVTQQVAGDGDKLNLKKIFKRGQGYKEPRDFLLKRYKQQMTTCGFKKVKYKVSDINYYFKVKKDLIDFLYKTPTVPAFSLSKEKKLVDKFMSKFRTAKGIKSNSKRFLLEGLKPNKT